MRTAHPRHKAHPHKHWLTRLLIVVIAILLTLLLVDRLVPAVPDVKVAGVIGLGPFLTKIIDTICDLVCDRMFPEL